jgi:hypothetical protein
MKGRGPGGARGRLPEMRVPESMCCPRRPVVGLLAKRMIVICRQRACLQAGDFQERVCSHDSRLMTAAADVPPTVSPVHASRDE